MLLSVRLQIITDQTNSLNKPRIIGLNKQLIFLGFFLFF